MAKGIIVVDIPENCENCLFSMAHAVPIQDYTYCTVLTRGVISKHQIKRPNWCPIKPIPDRKSEDFGQTIISAARGEGWNECLDEILKGV